MSTVSFYPFDVGVTRVEPAHAALFALNACVAADHVNRTIVWNNGGPGVYLHTDEGYYFLTPIKVQFDPEGRFIQDRVLRVVIKAGLIAILTDMTVSVISIRTFSAFQTQGSFSDLAFNGHSLILTPKRDYNIPLNTVLVFSTIRTDDGGVEIQYQRSIFPPQKGKVVKLFFTHTYFGALIFEFGPETSYTSCVCWTNDTFTASACRLAINTAQTAFIVENVWIGILHSIGLAPQIQLCRILCPGENISTTTFLPEIIAMSAAGNGAMFALSNTGNVLLQGQDGNWSAIFDIQLGMLTGTPYIQIKVSPHAVGLIIGTTAYSYTHAGGVQSYSLKDHNLLLLPDGTFHEIASTGN